MDFRQGPDGSWRPESKARQDWRALTFWDRVCVLIFGLYAVLWLIGSGNGDENFMDVIRAALIVGGIWIVPKLLAYR